MKRRDQSGMVSLWTVIWVLFFGCVLYAGFAIAPFFYNFYELENLMQAQADHASVVTDQEMRKTLVKTIKQLDIPVDINNDLRIERFGDHIEIAASYDEVFFVDFGEYGYYEIYTFHFEPFAEQKL